MSKFGFIERKIAFILSKAPFLKSIIKNVYIKINYLLFKSSKREIIDEGLTLEVVFENGFFGYYTSSPFNSKNDFICHGLKKKSDPAKNTFINIIYNGKAISSTNSWNYQQGAMLNWLTDESIIHNIFINGEFKSKIVDVKTGNYKIIDFPIYAVKGNIALSLNFTRLSKYRNEYGYNNIPIKNIKFDDNEDGVYLVDLVSNKVKLIISINELKNIKYDLRMENAVHKVNHIQFSPNGRDFIFFHRWFDKKGVKYTRLYFSNIEKTEIKIIADCDMISHCNFIDEKNIIGWMRQDGVDSYYSINVETGIHKKIEILNEDGHPSLSFDGKYLLTDTYPDRSGMQSVVLFDVNKNKIIKKSSLFSPIEFRGSKRSDLHPRFNPDNCGFTVDSVHNGVRSLCNIKLLEKI